MSSSGFDTFVNLYVFFFSLSKDKTASGDFAAFSTKSRFNQLPEDAKVTERQYTTQKNLELFPPRAYIL